jgi:hypothetical protein
MSLSALYIDTAWERSRILSQFVAASFRQMLAELCIVSQDAFLKPSKPLWK